MTLLIKLSIITVNLNNATGLSKTLASVASQTFTDYEHIIIDGGSTDGSVAIIKDYEQGYIGVPGYLYWVSEPDNGTYNAMNKGINKASGQYLFFLNSGDCLVETTSLQKVSEHLNKQHQIIYGNLYFSINGTIKPLVYPDRITFSYLAVSSLPHPAMFIHNKIFKTTQYAEHFKIVSDWLLYSEAILKLNATYLHIDQFISVFDTNGISSLPEHKNKQILEREKAKRTLFPASIWETAVELWELQHKYNGLINSKSIKVCIFLNKVLRRKKQ